MTDLSWEITFLSIWNPMKATSIQRNRGVSMNTVTDWLPKFLAFLFIYLHFSCQFDSHYLYFLLRLLKREETFTFIPRSREELPDNFPKEIPGICYFLEVRTGPKQPKPSLSSSRIRKVSYNIGTMFLRETSLWDLLQIKDFSKSTSPEHGSRQESGKRLFFTALLRTSSRISVMSGNNPRKRWVMTVNKKTGGWSGGSRRIYLYECFGSYIFFNYTYEPPFKANW